jgi:hypothetical protein
MGLQMKLGYQLLFAIMSIVIATIPQAALAKCMGAALPSGQRAGHFEEPFDFSVKAAGRFVGGVAAAV